MALDNKDRLIVAELKENSRQSIRDIARKTKLRPSTVHQRISRLIDEKVIEKFTVKLDNKAADENFIVFMLITTEHDLGQAFFQNPHVKEVFGITGEYDILVKLKFKDIDEFNTYVIQMRKNQAIKKTISMVATINLKEEV